MTRTAPPQNEWLVTIPAYDLKKGDRLVLPKYGAPDPMAHHFDLDQRDTFTVEEVVRVRPKKVRVTTTVGSSFLFGRRQRVERRIRG